MAQGDEDVHTLGLQADGLSSVVVAGHLEEESGYLTDWMTGRKILPGPGWEMVGVSSVTYPMIPTWGRRRMGSGPFGRDDTGLATTPGTRIPNR